MSVASFSMPQIIPFSLHDCARTVRLPHSFAVLSFYPHPAQGETAEENYRRSAGEVEARNATRRAALSPEERAVISPWETEDFPMDKQVVMFDSPELDFGTMSDNVSGTLGGLKEMQTVVIRRTANSYAEARDALAPQVGKTFQNKESGITATLSNNSVNKLLSGMAVAKSVGVKAHLAAVANVTELFENGRLLETDDGTRRTSAR